jgi:transposase
MLLEGENAEAARMSHLWREQQRDITMLYLTGMPVEEIASQFRVCPHTVYNVVRRETDHAHAQIKGARRMAASRDTAKQIADVIRRYVGEERIPMLAHELLEVRGNHSVRETVKMVVRELLVMENDNGE